MSMDNRRRSAKPLASPSMQRKERRLDANKHKTSNAKAEKRTPTLTLDEEEKEKAAVLALNLKEKDQVFVWNTDIGKELVRHKDQDQVTSPKLAMLLKSDDEKEMMSTLKLKDQEFGILHEAQAGNEGPLLRRHKGKVKNKGQVNSSKLKDRTGTVSSSTSIANKKHMQAEISDKKGLNGMFLKALKGGVADGTVKASYKLSSAIKTAAKKEAATSKKKGPAPKKEKATAPQKKTASKKKPSTKNKDKKGSSPKKTYSGSYQDAAIAPQPQHFESNSNSTKANENKNSLRRIAWLMSFPNSGTSYTSYLIRTVTQTNTGSNYGHESGIERSRLSPSVPIFDDNPIPTWIESWNDLLRQPSKGYILTKTHCGGFSFCPACESFIYNSQMFLKKCLEGDFVMKPEVVSKGYASKDKIARAVHVIRDPFDNVVARFRLERQTLGKKNKAHYPNTREGFRQFCDDLGKIELVEKAQKQAHVFVEDVADLVIPCKADFYRYIQWHNMAFTTTWNLGIPTLVVHYENYATSLNETKDALLEFLEQDEVADAPPFVKGKTYRDYYTADEIDAVSEMTERLALRESWQHTKHYFGQ